VSAGTSPGASGNASEALAWAHTAPGQKKQLQLHSVQTFGLEELQHSLNRKAQRAHMQSTGARVLQCAGVCILITTTTHMPASKLALSKSYHESKLNRSCSTCCASSKGRVRLYDAICIPLCINIHMYNQHKEDASNANDLKRSENETALLDVNESVLLGTMDINVACLY
jgi:hypothetical protein